MNEKDFMAWKMSIERRLDALDGGAKPERAAPPPAPKVKTEADEFPKFIYRRGEDGSIQSMLVNTISELPDVYAESPDEVDKALPNTPPPPNAFNDDRVTIPDDWAEQNGNTLIALARRLPGGDEVRTKDDAITIIELELERRGNASDSGE